MSAPQTSPAPPLPRFLTPLVWLALVCSVLCAVAALAFVIIHYWFASLSTGALVLLVLLFDFVMIVRVIWPMLKGNFTPHQVRVLSVLYFGRLGIILPVEGRERHLRLVIAVLLALFLLSLLALAILGWQSGVGVLPLLTVLLVVAVYSQTVRFFKIRWMSDGAFKSLIRGGYRQTR